VKEDENKEKSKFLDDLIAEQPVTRAYQKLNREPLKVSVFKNTSAIQALEEAITRVEELIEDADGEEIKTNLKAHIEETKKELVKLEQDKLEGALTHLTYRDINDIKAAVTDAVMHLQSYKLSPETVLGRIAAEERFMTIFCAFKQKNNTSVRYFATLDDIAQVDEMTIFDLYSQWEKYFVLTDEEIKN
jgi:hypothetical protein